VRIERAGMDRGSDARRAALVLHSNINLSGRQSTLLFMSDGGHAGPCHKSVVMNHARIACQGLLSECSALARSGSLVTGAVIGQSV
jgi:hypothetical protein